MTEDLDLVWPVIREGKATYRFDCPSVVKIPGPLEARVTKVTGPAHVTSHVGPECTLVQSCKTPWQCVKCRQHCAHDMTRCDACHGPGPPVPKRHQDRWMCDTCLVWNTSEVTDCIACQIPNRTGVKRQTVRYLFKKVPTPPDPNDVIIVTTNIPPVIPPTVCPEVLPLVADTPTLIPMCPGFGQNVIPVSNVISNEVTPATGMILSPQTTYNFLGQDTPAPTELFKFTASNPQVARVVHHSRGKRKRTRH